MIIGSIIIILFVVIGFLFYPDSEEFSTNNITIPQLQLDVNNALNDLKSIKKYFDDLKFPFGFGIYKNNREDDIDKMVVRIEDITKLYNKLITLNIIKSMKTIKKSK